MLTDEEIRERAYQIYLDRGCEDGQDLEDWLEARRALEQEQASEHQVSVPNRAVAAAR